MGFYLLLAVAHQWLPGGVFERAALVLACFHLVHGLLHVVFLRRQRLANYARGVVGGAPELSLLRQPGRGWHLRFAMLYFLAVILIVQGYYFVGPVIIFNLTVRYILIERLWGVGGLMEQARKDASGGTIEPSYDMEA